MRKEVERTKFVSASAVESTTLPNDTVGEVMLLCPKCSDRDRNAFYKCLICEDKGYIEDAQPDVLTMPLKRRWLQGRVWAYLLDFVRKTPSTVSIKVENEWRPLSLDIKQNRYVGILELMSLELTEESVLYFKSESKEALIEVNSIFSGCIIERR